MKNNICAIILARGGSKGLKNKNILNFCGRPLITWTIDACKKSGIKDIYVSSDSDKILDISINHGAKIIKRPKYLSQDNSTSESSWLHSLDFLKKINLNYELVVAPQVTSPIRKDNDIKKAIIHFKKNNFDSLISGNLAGDMLLWTKKGNNLKSLNYNFNKRLRRQNMIENIVENGSFYIFKNNFFRINKNRICGKFGFYLMDKWQQFEIDSNSDFILCEHLMKAYILNK